jgi:hypothetical protein
MMVIDVKNKTADQDGLSAVVDYDLDSFVKEIPNLRFIIYDGEVWGESEPFDGRVSIDGVEGLIEHAKSSLKREDKPIPFYHKWCAYNCEYVEDDILKAEYISQNKINEAKKYLNDTDWYVVRYAETGVDIPQEVKDKRQECREIL